jgi:hypothetical protein
MKIVSENYPYLQVLSVPLAAARANALRTRMATRSGSRKECSQTRSTDHPSARSCRATVRSRRAFLSTFACQNALLVLGGLKQVGQRCQKQPSTKTATFVAGQAKSGRPGNLRCLRQPVIRPARRIDLRRSSVLALPELLMDRMMRERSSGTGVVYRVLTRNTDGF